ncbi:MAG: site-specific recombinase [Glaciimonas sp.]|nr:site-specific recombinase [Glaciimonas sp.]
MKVTLLKIRVMWRRFRHGTDDLTQNPSQYQHRVEALMHRANSDGPWLVRANWLMDVAEWLRHAPTVMLQGGAVWRNVKNQRLLYLLDWLDAHRDERRLVQLTVQKSLREAAGPELFCATGLPGRQAFFGELYEHLITKLLPAMPTRMDLSHLITAMFPDHADALWLSELDAATLTRIWKLCGDDGIAHTYAQQIDEALTYLVTDIVATGISADFRNRILPRMPLSATPFMALRRELEAYLMAHQQDLAVARSVRMLIAVCQAQTDKIYAHLDEFGVSVGLVYSVERMRAQLARMSRLIEMRSAVAEAAQGAAQMQALLADLIHAHHQRSSLSGLFQRSFSLLARKMVERNADRGELCGEQYTVRDKAAYRTMQRAAHRGGVVLAFTVCIQFLLAGIGLVGFFAGAAASLNFALSFILIQAVGGVLAAKQPAVTAPALAAKMGQLDSVDSLRALAQEIVLVLRAQSAAIFGNLLAVIPAMLVISIGLALFSDAPILTPDKAWASLQSLSALGPTPLYAALTGVLLWLASLAAGYADNWFALRRLRESLTYQRRLVHVVGAARAARCALWFEKHIAGIAGNLAIGVLLGMTPVLAQFFGLPLDVRHVTLSTGTLIAVVTSLGWHTVLLSQFWLAVASIGLIGVLNVGVAFSCALALAMRARNVPARMRRMVLRMVWRRFSAAPLAFLFPIRDAEQQTAQSTIIKSGTDSE